MNVKIPRDRLQWLVQTASRPVPSRTTMHSIKGCLIEATSDRLVFTGTNLDWGVKVSMEAQVRQSGALVVSSKILDDVVRTMRSPEVELILDESAWALTVKGDSSEMVLNAVPADDFPEWPVMADGIEVAISGKLWRDLVRVGATCAVSNPARPLWGACLVEFREGKVVVVSTDQFALSRARASLDSSDCQAIVSASVIQDIARLTDTAGGDRVRLYIGENHMYVDTPDVSCFSRLISGQYYAYEQVIPRRFVTTVKVESESLLRAASRAAIVSSEDDRAMRVIVDEGRQILTVRAASSERGRMEEEIPCEIQGEAIEVWVQHKYIIQALGKIGTSTASIGMSGKASAMRIEPCPEEEGKEQEAEASYVVMPMSTPKGAF